MSELLDMIAETGATQLDDVLLKIDIELEQLKERVCELELVIEQNKRVKDDKF